MTSNVKLKDLLPLIDKKVYHVYVVGREGGFIAEYHLDPADQSLKKKAIIHDYGDCPVINIRGDLQIYAELDYVYYHEETLR